MLAKQLYPMTETEWEILDQLDRGCLRWSPAVGDCWKNLVGYQYVKPNFGNITEHGRTALEKWREDVDRKG
jgi:hypothetical protein